MSCPDTSPPPDDKKPEPDAKAPGHRSGEGAGSLHDHMQRDRERKNQDDAGRMVISRHP